MNLLLRSKGLVGCSLVAFFNDFGFFAFLAAIRFLIFSGFDCRDFDLFRCANVVPFYPNPNGDDKARVLMELRTIVNANPIKSEVQGAE